MARQSPPDPVAAGFELDPASVAAVLPSAPAEVEVAVESLESAGFDDLGVRVAARSFFAQPEPLNRIAGVLKPFFSVPSAPQFGQNRGPASWIPWTTSVRWPQLEQT
jgi:hypothetical protein